MAAIQQQIWARDIQELLYPPNSILMKTTDHSQYVHYRTVNLPQAGANGNVVKNRALGGSFASTYQRTDTILTYNIDSYSVDPIIISDLEEFQLSYDKRKSILYNAMKNVETVLCDEFMYQIAPATGATRTTGALSATSLPFNYTGATAVGTRRQITIQDVMTLKAVLDKQNVPQTDRVMIVPADMWNNELLLSNNVLNAYQYASVNLSQSVVATATAPNIFGFETFHRPSTVIYSSGGTLNTPVTTYGGVTPAVAASDCWGVLAWHPAFVGFAKGQIQTFYQEVAAAAYGSVISFDVWAGGSELRSDGAGIAVLIQAIS